MIPTSASPSDTVTKLKAEITSLRATVAELTDQLQWLRRQVFGAKSERSVALFPDFQAVQLALPGFEKPTAPVPEPVVTIPEHPRRKKSCKKEFPNNAGVSGLRFNDSVEIEEILCENPKIAGLAPEQYEVIGKETVDKLCQRKSSYFIRRYIRDKVKIKESKEITIAPPPPSVVKGSFLDVSFLAWMVIEKILYHSTLHRVHQKVQEGGVLISRSTLTNAFHAMGDMLQPVLHAQCESILSGRLITMDETPGKIGRDEKKRTMHTGRFWSIYGDNDEVAFLAFDSRRHEVVDTILQGKFSGVLLSDDYAAYKAYAKKYQAVTHALCWSHSRRCFADAAPVEPKKVHHVIKLIKELYKNEANIRTEKLCGYEKYAYREEHSTPIVESIFLFLKEELQSCAALPKSPFTKAVLYTLDNEKELREFLKNPDIPIDTNHLERANRAIALGRKNWLFCSSELGAEYVSLFYSLLCTARLQGINPYEYLVDILPRVRSCPTEALYSLTPRGWKNQRVGI